MQNLKYDSAAFVTLFSGASEQTYPSQLLHPAQPQHGSAGAARAAAVWAAQPLPLSTKRRTPKIRQQLPSRRLARHSLLTGCCSNSCCVALHSVRLAEPGWSLNVAKPAPRHSYSTCLPMSCRANESIKAHPPVTSGSGAEERLKDRTKPGEVTSIVLPSLTAWCCKSSFFQRASMQLQLVPLGHYCVLYNSNL